MKMTNKYYFTPREVMAASGEVKEFVDTEHISRLSNIIEHVFFDSDYYDRACISMPPRMGKSSLLTLATPFWLILNNPYLNIIIVNNTQTLADNFGIRLRQMFIDNEDLLAKFGITLSTERHARATFMFKKDGELAGSIKLMGAMGTITGQDVDVLLVDDIQKGFTDTTPTLLEKMYNYFTEILLQRLEPHSKMIILQTRWHSQDVIGRLKQEQSDKYKFIEIPALREDGSCIFPERYKPEFFYEREREMGTRMFQTLYQCTPMDMTGDFFDLDCLRFNEEPRDIIASVRAWDMAYSESDTADYTAGVLMLKSEDNTVYIQDLVHGRFGNKNKSKVLATAKKEPDTPIGIEYGVGASAKLLSHEWKSYLKGYNVREITPIKSKEDRAFGLSNAILDGEVVCNLKGKSLEAFMKELTAFPDGVHDDIVDATAHSFNLLRRKKKLDYDNYIIEI